MGAYGSPRAISRPSVAAYRVREAASKAQGSHDEALMRRTALMVEIVHLRNRAVHPVNHITVAPKREASLRKH
jgi:hypothetical protein